VRWNGAVLENFCGVVDVADEEILADLVRHRIE
jgi:hypothetical protein